MVREYTEARGIAPGCRIWDKRAEGYVDTLTAVHHRRLRREHGT